MEGPRAPRDTEIKDVVQFLNENLRHDAGWSITQEYPTAFDTENLDNFRIIKDNDKILSHALVKTVIVKTRRALFKVGCIGSVITHQAYRHQGLSQKILESCLDSVQKQGCDFAILWTNLYDFYRRLGFELAGSEVSLLIDKPLALPDDQYHVVESSQIDPQILLRLYGQHTVSTIRTVGEVNQYAKIPNSRIYTAWTSDQRCEAYAVEGKGADLQGYIHEWGGHIGALSAIVKKVRDQLDGQLTVISPSHSVNFIHRLEALGARRVDGFLGMIKLTNPASFFQKIHRNVRSEWGLSNFVLEYRGSDIYFGLGKQLFKTNQERDIVRLLFGPEKPSKVHNCGDDVNQVLNEIFPIELWIWGWDSV